jgi:hypothetical protein
MPGEMVDEGIDIVPSIPDQLINSQQSGHGCIIAVSGKIGARVRGAGPGESHGISGSQQGKIRVGAVALEFEQGSVCEVRYRVYPDMEIFFKSLAHSFQGMNLV